MPGLQQDPEGIEIRASAITEQVASFQQILEVRAGIPSSSSIGLKRACAPLLTSTVIRGTARTAWPPA